MKLTTFSAILILTGACANVLASSPALAEAAPASPRFVLYSDGKSTYVKSVPGLIVPGATADGDRLILPGVQLEVQGYFAGKPVTIAQYTAPAAAAPAQNTATLNDRLKRLEEELQRKEKAFAAASAAATPAATTEPQKAWELKFSDGTVREALKRWTKEAGLQLAYAEQKDFPVPVEATYNGTISEAVEGLMKSLRHSTYPLRACEYDNKVILILHRNKVCPEE